MFKKILIGLLGFIFAVIFLECSMRMFGDYFLYLQSQGNETDSKSGLRVLCLGESTTVGTKGDFSWPSQLESILNQRFDLKAEIFNRGIAEIDSTVIVNNLIDNLNKFKPNFVVVMMGINDMGTVEYYKNFKFFNKKLFNTFKIYKIVCMFINDIIKGIPEKKIKNLLNKEKLGKRLDIVYFDLAQEYLKLFDLGKTEEMLKKSIKANFRNIKAYIFLGALYSEFRSEEAISILEEAKKIFPNEKQIYYLISENYMRLGKLNEAELELKHYLEINPNSYLTRIRLGHVFMLDKKYDFAEQYIVNSLSQKVSNSLANIEVAKFYKAIGKFTEAKIYLKKALEIDKKNILAQNYLNELNNEDGEYINPKTRENYIKIKQILDKYSVKLVCMQYPVRSIKPLNKVFENYSGVLFVDNEWNFKQAIEKQGAYSLFVDLFADDFGHCTKEGNRLIAENVATVIKNYLQELPK